MLRWNLWPEMFSLVVVLHIESVKRVCQLLAEFDGAMCHFMEIKVLPAHLETGPNIFFINCRACQIPQPITCSYFYFTTTVLHVNQDLTVNQSASALNSHFFCLANMQCNTALAWLLTEHGSVTDLPFSLWVKSKQIWQKSKAVYKCV